MNMAKKVKERVGTVSKAPVAHGVGRRKAAVARVWFKRGKGSILVNGSEIERYFDTEVSRAAAVAPLYVLPAVAKNYDIAVNVYGGGKGAQAGAIGLALSRAFVILHEDARPLLRSHNLLTVDSRVKERKKYGQKAARRRFQFVKR